VSGLRVDTAAHTGKESHGRSAHTEGQHGACDVLDRQMEDETEQQVPDGDVKKTEANHRKSHNGTGGESHVQSLVQTLLAGSRCSRVGSGGNLHSHEARKTREESACQEGKRNEP